MTSCSDFGPLSPSVCPETTLLETEEDKFMLLQGVSIDNF